MSSNQILDIGTARERIAELEAKLEDRNPTSESDSGGVLAWLRDRFGDPTSQSDGSKVNAESDDDKEDDDDEDKNARIAKLEAAVNFMQQALGALEGDNQKLVKLEQDVNRLGAQVRILTERLSGDIDPKGSVETGAQGGSIESQLRSHQEIQNTLPNWQDRQAYGQEHIVPLQKKLGRLQA